MIKNVFFDFNGTLLDDLNLCFKIEEEIKNIMKELVLIFQNMTTQKYQKSSFKSITKEKKKKLIYIQK